MRSSVVHSESEQTSIFSGLVEQMMAQGELIGVPQVPGQVDMQTGTTMPVEPAGQAAPAAVPGGDKIGAKPAQPAKQQRGTDQSITANVANQGQLIPIAAPIAPGGSTDDMSDLKRIVGQLAGDQQNPAEGAEPKKDGGGDILDTVINVGLSFLGWIICTELVRQGKMPRKWWVKGARVFANYPEFVRQGYYLWARPCVRHLRRFPNSWFSYLLCIVFNVRAKSIAEKQTIAGIAVTVVLWPICWCLGAAMWLFSIELDYTTVYREVK